MSPSTGSGAAQEKKRIPMDLLVVAWFLEENFELFQMFLEENEIESTEAEVIVSHLKDDVIKRNRKRAGHAN